MEEYCNQHSPGRGRGGPVDSMRDFCTVSGLYSQRGLLNNLAVVVIPVKSVISFK